MAEVEVIQPTSALSNDENAAPSSDEIKTVFHDVNDFNVKHPLMNTWSLWVCRSEPVKLIVANTASLLSPQVPREIIGMTC